MQTLASVAPISALLEALEVGKPLSHGALTVIPLLAPREAEPDWLTLAEAGAAVTITEVSSGGEVPMLSLVNDADRPVLLLDGEELIGAKQNRILNTTVLVAAHAALRIPVSCVEHGRWSYRGKRFDSSDASLFASAHAKKATRVSTSLRQTGLHLSDQGEIWRDVAGKVSEHRVQSATGAMRDFYDRYAGDLAEARRALAPKPGQIGALVAVACKWIGLDLLPSPGLFERAWPRLFAGYAAEAVGREEHAAAPDPRAILKGLAQTPTEDAPAVGLGHEHRLAGNAMVGAALVVEEKVAHLMVFPARHSD
jgi:hypothetical protein